MNLTDNIEIIGPTLFLKKEKTLVIADIHLGMEQSLQKKGILIPNFQFNEIKKILEPILAKTKPEAIVINGDFKHEFGKIHQQEWKEGLMMIDFLKSKCKKLILTKGNHDPLLFPIAKKRKIPIKENGILIGKTFITHGNKIPKIPKASKTIIIGDAHPAIGLTDNEVTETFKCFLKGKWNKKTLIIQPSMCQLATGTDILREKIKTPFAKNLDDFEVFVVADKTFYFGKLKDITAQ